MPDSVSPALPAPSAFLHLPVTVPRTATPSIIHLKRDLLLPLTFPAPSAASTAPAAVLTTRFGDFPHASIFGRPYGSQIRATNLGHSNRKRKRRNPSTATTANDNDPDPHAQNDAHNTSGFLHVLAPTAELWTSSLPHRTQVVYTPDSSYILHKLRVRPGSVLLEAGAGSGSFTHAGVRAVYHGYPDAREGPAGEGDVKPDAKGRVWSFEFHEERVKRLRVEIVDHGLQGLVQVVHRDVCKDGFLVGEDGAVKSPGATAVFLDLPAPWLALPHLTRTAHPPAEGTEDTPSSSSSSSTPLPPISPLSQTSAVRICTFSPCIEQVTRTVSTLRKLGWVEIEMHELQHRRIEVRRSNRRGYEDGAGPRSVTEAVQRLKWVGEYRNTKAEKDAMTRGEVEVAGGIQAQEAQGGGGGGGPVRKGAAEGMMVTRVEPEVKSHTSYLVFAVLPREWAPEAEAEVAAYVKATTKGVVDAPVVGEGEKWKWVPAPGVEKAVSKRQMKKMERMAKKEAAGEGVKVKMEREQDDMEIKMEMEMDVDV